MLFTVMIAMDRGILMVSVKLLLEISFLVSVSFSVISGGLIKFIFRGKASYRDEQNFEAWRLFYFVLKA